MSQVNSEAEETPNDDISKNKQWEAINNHLKQMDVWTDDGHSPLSTSPGNTLPKSSIQANFVQRPHLSHNPMYRRSEGDLDGKTTETVRLNHPPQSAPILQEGVVPNWSNPTAAFSVPVSNPYVGLPTSNQSNIATQSASSSSFVTNGQPISFGFQNLLKTDLEPGNLPIPVKPPVADPYKYGNEPVVFLPSESFHHGGSGHSSGSSSPQVVRQTSSPNLAGTLPPKHVWKSKMSMHNLPNETKHSSPFMLHSHSAYALYQTPQNSVFAGIPQSSDACQGSPSMRRQSMPVKMEMTPAGKPSLAQRAVSQTFSNNDANQTHSFGNHDHIFQSVVPSSLGKVEEHDPDLGKDDDKEYTIALLQHQQERMNRLQTELETKKRELASMVSDMHYLEKSVIDRSTRSSSSMLLDVGRLREINRQLKIDCNCMHREVEHFFRDGDNTRDSFYSRYNRVVSLKTAAKRKGFRYPDPKDLPPPPVPPPQERDDEPKWRCKYCTFDNHAALNKCEICEYSRDVQSSRIRIS